MNRVDTLGENAMVARLRRLLPPGGAGVVTGIGDDCAVVRPSAGGDRDWLLTSDPVIEGRHFLSDTPPERIGHKAVGRVLSDLAAMGGDPLWGLVDLVVPTDTPMERVEGVYRGLAALAGRWGLGIVGGDVAAGPVLELHVFGVGSVPRGAAILRSGAREGDVVCVTGALGGSRAGRQYTFTPRLDEGRFLREGGWATAMMDVTDGLAADLPRLAAASGVSAEIRLEDLPLHPDTRLTDRSPVRQALEDGEDFIYRAGRPIGGIAPGLAGGAALRLDAHRKYRGGIGRSLEPFRGRRAEPHSVRWIRSFLRIGRIPCARPT